MKVNDILYFAPGIKFGAVDIDGPKLPEQFKQRMAGFYIVPSEECAERGHAFASGVLSVTAIDAMARLLFPDVYEVGVRFRDFAAKKLKSFSDPCIAKRFYEEFRNGLVHESSLKNGAQFSLEFGETVRTPDGHRLVINPKYLAAEVRCALNVYVGLLDGSEEERINLSRRLKDDLVKDFEAV